MSEEKNDGEILLKGKIPCRIFKYLKNNSGEYDFEELRKNIYGENSKIKISSSLSDLYAKGLIERKMNRRTARYEYMFGEKDFEIREKSKCFIVGRKE